MLRSFIARAAAVVQDTLPKGQFRRIASGGARETIRFRVDGEARESLAGDTILTALLTSGPAVRRHEFDGRLRAGFCAMGACQDCWVTLADGTRLRACTTPLTEDMDICLEASHGAA